MVGYVDFLLKEEASTWRWQLAQVKMLMVSFAFFTALLYFIFLLVFPFGRATYWVLMGAGGPRFVIDWEG